MTVAVDDSRRVTLRVPSKLHLAPAAQARGLTEEEMMPHVKEARRYIWQDQYREMVRSLYGLLCVFGLREGKEFTSM
jgi:hypothetical protein